MKRILVVRNDKIGDFMLAWPSFAMLKGSMACHVTALVPAYTAPLARLCPWIDEVIIDPGVRADKLAQRALLAQIKAAVFDAAICLFSNSRNAMLMWQARIPYRLAPATKLAQVLYNQRVVQRRSRSQKPESEYNLELIRRFLADQQVAVVEPLTPFLRFADETLLQVREQLAAKLKLDVGRPWLMVHAGSGGSANNLSIAQYARIIIKLNKAYPALQCVLTAGPGEEQMAEQLAAELLAHGGNGWIYRSNDGLPMFCQVLANAALFIAGSTGPLHIAGALDVPTVGFFPMRRSATPLRWRPLNSEGRHLAFSPPEESDHLEDMSQLDPESIVPAIANWVKQVWPQGV
ncbi:glycosyltransferase family 9 protein [Aeromonas cavernicola]|uniref:ADP-heptose--LPS heptosyltransferase n=1 Tax=Aeromonas cavernicola TaxID=1006623 RepID=A0A2H9U524_9GAMM|nr:glycosyltransferase family 9 protein [Aeromonas cavernicola]PJG59153.1 ADP-heptose--LPS heptosyltransferase [Aeromonas cavernicola]